MLISVESMSKATSAQRPQQVAHELGAVGRLGDLALDAQLVVAGQLDVRGSSAPAR
jgi:hypothetical protein